MKSSPILTADWLRLQHDSVYTQYSLTVDGTYGEATPDCNGARGCCKYAACDPVTSDPSGKTWKCASHGACATGSTWGRSAVAERYPTAHCHNPAQPWCAWKFNTSKLMGGFWYSTLSEGDCDHVSGPCSWRIKEVVKTVNASCVNGFLHKAVETTGSQCFAGCGTNSTNVDSDCWVECFYRTILQEPKMTAEELVAPWERAFQHGGCPSLPPYAPPPAPA
eukprot:COSAG06_NODE_5053_length_3759_cov_2.454645_2_plen_221_part_00